MGTWAEDIAKINKEELDKQLRGYNYKLRDKFATAAMNGLLSKNFEADDSYLSNRAYDIADAMLEEKERRYEK